MRRRLTWRFEEDGSLSGTFRLPPLARRGAAEGAARGLRRPRGPAGRAARRRFRGNARRRGDARRGTPAADQPAASAPVVRTSSDLADGLVAVAESFLAGKVAGADDAGDLPGRGARRHRRARRACGPGRRPPRFRGNAGGRRSGVSAETPAAAARVPGDPADPARCHVEDGPAISVSTAQMIACTAALSWMTARRRRRGPGPGPPPPPPQLRDPPRRPRTRPRPLPVPGLRVPPGRPAPHPALDQRRPHRPGQPDQPVPLAPHGGPRPRLPHRRRTPARLLVLPPRRHPAARQPALPEPDGSIAPPTTPTITPDTIIPPWYGERLDLDHAIYVCFANARTRQERERDPDGPPRGRVRIYEPEDCDER